MGEAGFELVMPFVVCHSQGGPYDDDAYVAGWEMGKLDVALGLGLVDDELYLLHAENRSQADLVAMRHGYIIEVEETGVDGWIQVTFRRHPL